MKKIISIIAIILLLGGLLFALTGCGAKEDMDTLNNSDTTNNRSSNNNNSNTDNDKPDMSLPEIYGGSEWPTAYLPKGITEFKDGSIMVIADPGYVIISYLRGEDGDGFMEYINNLKNDGWKVEAPIYGIGSATKGKWEIIYASGEAPNVPGVWNHTLSFTYEQ